MMAIQQIFDLSGIQLLLLLGIAGGVALTVVGIARTLTDKSPAAIRMAGKPKGGAIAAQNGIVRLSGPSNSGIAGSLIPETAEERFAVQRALSQAGFRSRNAMRNFYLIRLMLGLGMPLILLGTISLAQGTQPWVPMWIKSTFGTLSGVTTLQILSVTCAVGFFGPAMWLNGLINERKRKIEESFPNALDLIQIGVEAGLGFDAAITRTATEISDVAPDVSEEFLIAQSEIQAGKDRQTAFLDMAKRTGVEEVNSFVNVVLQSIQFGTSISDALTSYAEEMRKTRELKAEEKANKLPVQMSAIMASLMLPAILMLSLGPVVIRYLRYFAE